MIPGIVAGAPTIWTPAALSPRFWVDDGTSITDVSGSASQWNDRSANAFHMSQATGANRPLIVPTAINGRRGIQFDGTSDRLTNSSVGAKAIFRNVSSAWGFIVFKRTATGTATRVLFGGSNNSDAGRARFRMDIASEKLRLAQLNTDGTTPLTTSGATNIDTNWHTVLMTMNWSTASGAIYLDGVLDGSASSFGTTASTANTQALGDLTIGSNMNGTEAFANVTIACVIAGANSLPDSVARGKLFEWADNRYGL